MRKVLRNTPREFYLGLHTFIPVFGSHTFGQLFFFYWVFFFKAFSLETMLKLWIKTLLLSPYLSAILFVVVSRLTCQPINFQLFETCELNFNFLIQFQFSALFGIDWRVLNQRVCWYFFTYIIISVIRNACLQGIYRIRIGSAVLRPACTFKILKTSLLIKKTLSFQELIHSIYLSADEILKSRFYDITLL